MKTLDELLEEFAQLKQNLIEYATYFFNEEPVKDPVSSGNGALTPLDSNRCRCWFAYA